MRFWTTDWSYNDFFNTLLRFNHEGFCDELYAYRKTPRVRPLHRLSQQF
jgi:hypothetical protein